MKHSGAGFSLVELMVTVAVVGMIASLVVPNSSPDRDRLQLDAAARRLQLGRRGSRWLGRGQHGGEGGLEYGLGSPANDPTATEQL